jgi:hypothetical protein
MVSNEGGRRHGHVEQVKQIAARGPSRHRYLEVSCQRDVQHIEREFSDVLTSGEPPGPIRSCKSPAAITAKWVSGRRGGPS